MIQNGVLLPSRGRELATMSNSLESESEPYWREVVHVNNLSLRGDSSSGGICLDRGDFGKLLNLI